MKRLLRSALPAVVALLALLLTVATASAAPSQPTASSPAANAILGAPPQRIVIDAPGGAPGRVTVYDSNHKTVASVPARPVGGALVAPLPHLSGEAGIYSVVWRAGSETGSFAFQVSPGGASPALVQEPQPDNSLTPVKEALPATSPSSSSSSSSAPWRCASSSPHRRSASSRAPDRSSPPPSTAASCSSPR